MESMTGRRKLPSFSPITLILTLVSELGGTLPTSAQSPPSPLKIKVLGERNTGTNYLSLLLTSNSYPSLLSPHYTLGWKHSAPSSSSSRDVLYLCCVRPASDWLASTHARPYHMVPRSTFPEFLRSNVLPLEPRPDHPCHEDPTVPPLELYRRKCLSFERFMEGEGVRGAIVPLPWLQVNAAGFLKEVRDRFGLVLRPSFRGVGRHTKTGEVWGGEAPRAGECTRALI